MTAHDYLVVHNDASLLTHEDALGLCRAARGGDMDARRKMIESNIPLALSVGQRYFATQAADRDAIVSAAMNGLVVAVDRFDPDQGYLFSTYAVYWIRRSIGRMLADESNLVRVPVWVQAEMSKIRKGQAVGGPSKGPSVSLARLAMAAKTCGASAHRGEDECEADLDWRLAAIPSPLPSPDDLAIEAERRRVVREAVDDLSLADPRAATVVRMRMGLDGETSTLAEVGEALGVGAERVRQIEQYALASLGRRLGRLSEGPASIPARRPGQLQGEDAA